jgi:hypothetical protein
MSRSVAANFGQSNFFRTAGEGLPLPPILRNEWEPRLGADLSFVRVHADAASAAAARESGASGMAFGHDLFFGSGGYDHRTQQGRLLLGHELAHALQTRGSGREMPAPASASARESSLEREAWRVGTALAGPGRDAVSITKGNQPCALRGDKKIRFSGKTITVTDTYVIHGPAATPAFESRFRSALNNYYNTPKLFYRGYQVQFNLSVRQANYAGGKMTDSSSDSGTELFEVKKGTGEAGGFFELTLYEGDDEGTIAHEVGHYLSDKIGYFSERYSEGFFSRLGSIFGATRSPTTPDPGCEGDIMATTAGKVTNCSLSDFLDRAIYRENPPRCTPQHLGMGAYLGSDCIVRQGAGPKL